MRDAGVGDAICDKAGVRDARVRDAGVEELETSIKTKSKMPECVGVKSKDA